MKKLRFMLLVVAGIGFCACSCGTDQNIDSLSGTQITISNWNLQTFFDGTKDGCEYKEYQKSADWNTETYRARLGRLCEFITKTDADIYVFEELEKEEIFYDISNQLAAGGHNWNQKKFWNYSVFVKEEGTAIGIGILSRYPLSNVKTHSMDIRIHSTAQPVTRYILEAQASIEKNQLIILANHWKSKSGGEAETEIWRDWQESLLGKRLSELQEQSPSPAILICGDFNRNANDFVCSFNQPNSGNTIIRFADFGFTDSVSVKSLWFTSSGNFVSSKGSYFYNNEWEHIDNIMIVGPVQKNDFYPLAVSPWATEDGYPVPYKLYSGQGWSDHLPLYARICFYSD